MFGRKSKPSANQYTLSPLEKERLRCYTATCADLTKEHERLAQPQDPARQYLALRALRDKINCAIADVRDESTGHAVAMGSAASSAGGAIGGAGFLFFVEPVTALSLMVVGVFAGIAAGPRVAQAKGFQGPVERAKPFIDTLQTLDNRAAQDIEILLNTRAADIAQSPHADFVRKLALPDERAKLVAAFDAAAGGGASAPLAEKNLTPSVRFALPPPRSMKG